MVLCVLSLIPVCFSYYWALFSLANQFLDSVVNNGKLANSAPIDYVIAWQYSWIADKVTRQRLNY